MRSTLMLLVAVFIVSAASVHGDTWFLPTSRKYYSANRKFRVDVVPRKLESQLRFFQDLDTGLASPGAAPGEDFSRPRAVFHTNRKWWWGYTKKYEFPLVNDVAPVDALVSQTGDYFITFDNWHMMGYGDDVVVIYRSGGEVVASFGLDDLLTEGDIETLPRSVSSISWGGEHRIDEGKGHLVLQVVSNGNTGVRTPHFEELRIDLHTGRPMQARQDRFPRLRSRVTIEPAADPALPEIEDKLTCRSPQIQTNSAELQTVSTENLLGRATQKALPEYPVLALAARVQGTVTVAVIVDGMGAVACVGLTSGHPLLNRSALDAAFLWQFSDVPAGSSVLGAITFGFKQSIEPSLPIKDSR